eukprot:TRINITY_DN2196_c1_g1_i1.p1 TRINITY_DN2196_c1_g1~~TRINITY_DN2196_c1_g1_i1.p1  ORF type:complete len:315 (+),score=78.61 TRINITY_DN2196_c1_g1_i1:58-1002(+)
MSTVQRGIVVGYGRAGHIHMGNLSKMDDVRVKYIVDPCEDTKVPEGVKHVTSLEAALCDEEVDFVVVCSPTWSHYEDISKSLKAGKHVFAEKPLCTETAQISLVYGDAAESGKLLFTAFNRRYDPFLMNAKKRYESGEAGGVLSGMMVSRDYPYPSADYLKISGNLFKDCVVHDLDSMVWMMGETPVSVTATARCPGTKASAGTIESSQVFLKFASGKVITLMSSRVSKSYDQRLELYCQKDDIIVSNPVSEAPLTFVERYRESYVIEMKQFIASIARGDATPNVSFEHALLLETLIKACHESVDTGREIAISA